MSSTVTYRCLPPGHNVEKIQMRTRHLATVSVMCDIKSVIVAHSCLFDLFIFAPRHRFTLVLLKTCKPVNWFCLVRYHSSYQACHGDVIKWKHFLRYWLLCGEFTGRWWIPLTKASDAQLWCFLLICAWTNGWVNNWDAGDLRHHRTQYDVAVMWQLCWSVHLDNFLFFVEYIFTIHHVHIFLPYDCCVRVYLAVLHILNHGVALDFTYYIHIIVSRLSSTWNAANVIW